MLATGPSVIVLGGPNGAGKTTAAPQLLKGRLRVTEFVNADLIARGLSPFDPDGAAIPAAAIMLRRIRELAGRCTTFAFETTLSTRSLERWLSDLVNTGYRCRVAFLWLPHPDLAVARVRERVAAGGHDIPEDTVRRRYKRGIYNFLELYQPLAVDWRVYDNSSFLQPRIIATGVRNEKVRVADSNSWELMKSSASE